MVKTQKVVFATYMKSIKGIRFKQKTVQFDCRDAKAGQTFLVKSLLLVLILIVGFLLVLTASNIGGVTGLNIVYGKKAPLAWGVMAIATVVAIGTAVFSRPLRSFFAVFLCLFIFAILPELLSVLRILNFSFSEPFFSLTVLIVTSFGLAISMMSFLGVRFILALTDIVFVQSLPVKLVCIPAFILGSISGSFLAISGELEAPNSEFVELLALSENARLLVIFCGVIYGLSLALCSWLANCVRNTPWNYPGLQRLWALAVGSWWGTSFVNLDLSHVDFSGAQLANTDLRARKLYRTCFKGAIGLERARVDDQYLDLENPRVQKLLTHGNSPHQNFCGFNLRGAYLQNVDMRDCDLTDTDLTGADLKGADLRRSRLIRTQLARTDFQGVDLRDNILIDANLTEADFRGADLRGCILLRSQVARANFERADITGICIEDWSVSSQTSFKSVRCDYVFKRYNNGQPTHRYPADRDFEPGEFAALFQQSENELELIFKGDFSYSALSLAFYKLKVEEPGLNLELKGIEQRGDLWVVRVTSANPVVEAQLEQEFNTRYQAVNDSGGIESTIKNSIYSDYEEIKQRWAESQQLVRQLTGISASQAEALKQLSKQTLGANFYISGSTITNMTGQGEIEYTEAAGQIRSLVTGQGEAVTEKSDNILAQLNAIATTPNLQEELVQQIVLTEALNDQNFRNLLLVQQQKILATLPPGAIATAIQSVITQLTEK